MASSSDNLSMAVFCDFENVALGVRDANYEKFDIKPVLERLLLKGNIVVKKAYCDWERYKGFKAAMHEANFELIEIPHVRQSGKNSADIRLVVDALDLCYTKSHVNTFVIISGDSDFSPLVSKLRENAKQVIGVGVKQSTSDLLVANCDEFIFYDDLVRESRRARRDSRDTREAQPQVRRTPEEDQRRKEEQEARKVQAIDMAVETFDALVSERGDSGKIWASLLKDAIKRRKPDFNEAYYGFKTFGMLLEEAQSRGLLEFGRDDKSGAYVYRNNNAAAARVTEAVAPQPVNGHGQAHAEPAPAAPATPDSSAKHEPRRKSRGGRKVAERAANKSAGDAAPAALAEVVEIDTARAAAAHGDAVVATPVAAPAASADVLEVNVGQPEPRRGSRGAGKAADGKPARKPAARKPAARKGSAAEASSASAAAEPVVVQVPAEPVASDAAPVKKPAARNRRPRKPKEGESA